MTHRKKETREFLRLIATDGWEYVGQTPSSHLKVHHPATGATATIAQTPSDHRSRLNNRTRLRRLAATSRPRSERQES